MATADLLDAILVGARSERDVILSSEGFLFAEHERFDWFVSQVQTRRFTPQVTCVVRDVKGWVASHLSLAAKSGAILEADGSLSPSFDMRPAQGVKNLARFATSIATPITFIPYSRHTLLHDFLTAVGEGAHLESVVTPLRRIAERLTREKPTEASSVPWPPFGDRALRMIGEAVQTLEAAGLPDVVNYLEVDSFLADQRLRSREIAPLHLAPAPLDEAAVEALIAVLLTTTEN